MNPLTFFGTSHIHSQNLQHPSANPKIRGGKAEFLRWKVHVFSEKMQEFGQKIGLYSLIRKVQVLFRKLLILLRYAKARTADAFTNWKKKQQFKRRFSQLRHSHLLPTKGQARSLFHHAKATVGSVFKKIQEKFSSTEKEPEPPAPREPIKNIPTPVLKDTTKLSQFLSPKEIQQWEAAGQSSSSFHTGKTMDSLHAKSYLFDWLCKQKEKHAGHPAIIGHLNAMMTSLPKNNKAVFYAGMEDFFTSMDKMAVRNQEKLLWSECKKTFGIFFDESVFINATSLLYLLDQQKEFEQKLRNISDGIQRASEQLDLGPDRVFSDAFLSEEAKKLEAFQIEYDKQLNGKIDCYSEHIPLHCAAHVGEIFSLFREIEKTLRAHSRIAETLSPAGGKPEQTNVSSYYNADFAKTNGLIFTIGTGEGHRSAASAVQSYAECGGGQAAIIDTSEGVWVKNHIVSRLGKALGTGWKPADICNLTHKYQLYSINNFFRKTGELLKKSVGKETALGVLPPGLSETESHKLFLRTAILAQKPDYIVTTYHQDLNPILEIAEDLGIPVLHVSTDLDTKINEVFPNDKVLDHPNFTFFVPYQDPSIHTEPLSGEQIGYLAPVRTEMLRSFSEKERQSIKRKRNLDPDVDVVAFMGGSMGQNVPYLMKLANNLDYNKPLHCIVVAGKNGKLAKDLKKKLQEKDSFYQGKNANITIEIAEHASEEGERNEYPYFLHKKEMAEVYEIADAVVCSKMGGGTTFELIQQGIPVLMDRTKEQLFSWEKINFKILQGKRQAREFNNENFVLSLEEVLKNKHKMHAFHLNDPIRTFIDRVKQSREGSS